jgi:hypothetical protein
MPKLTAALETLVVLYDDAMLGQPQPRSEGKPIPVATIMCNLVLLALGEMVQAAWCQR